MRSSESESLRRRLEDAQRSFYSGHYEAAAALSVSLCAAGADNDLEACELRTSSLHFQIRRAMGDAADRERAWTMCATCPDLLSLLIADIDARARSHGHDSSGIRTTRQPCLAGQDRPQCLASAWERVDARLVGTSIGRRGRLWTACSNAILAISARASRAWIDYIVGTKMPRGTRWLLGGGNKKKGLRWFAKPPAALVTSSSAQRRRLPSGTCRSARGNLWRRG